ncbi:MAG: ECF transporter S component [Stackebrandtia sp.]
MTSAKTTWRTVDVVVAAVLAVAFGVVFWAWGLLWNSVDAVFSFYPPAKAVLYGVWLIPAVLSVLIIRKPGSGVFTEGLASTISALLGSFWGMTVIWQGLLQGVGGEAPFAASGYRRFSLPVAMAGGALATFAATLYDSFTWYSNTGWLEFRIPFIAVGMISGAIVAGIGSTYLTKALAGTGVLDRFPAGRDRVAV